MGTLKDRFWLYGRPERVFSLQKKSRMTPLEGALYLRAHNLFFGPYGIGVNREQYNKSFKGLKNVGWDITGAGFGTKSGEKLVEESKLYPNITCAVLDDVFDDCGDLDRWKDFPSENLIKLRKTLHETGPRPLDMWMMLYTRELGRSEKHDAELKPYIDAFDGVILWTWIEEELPQFEEKLKIFKKLAKGKRLMLGCFLYNFGRTNNFWSAEATQKQLDRFRELIYAGEAEGIVFHSNYMADINLPAFDTAVKWVDEHGDEEI